MEEAGCSHGVIKTKSPRRILRSYRGFCYAADGGRTRTLSPERDFKSLVSANFTTAAYNANNNTIQPLLCQEKLFAAPFPRREQKELFLSGVSCYNKLQMPVCTGSTRRYRRAGRQNEAGQTAPPSLPGQCPHKRAGGK